jgi:hypothetical protein
MHRNPQHPGSKDMHCNGSRLMYHWSRTGPMAAKTSTNTASPRQPNRRAIGQVMRKRMPRALRQSASGSKKQDMHRNPQHPAVERYHKP